MKKGGAVEKDSERTEGSRPGRALWAVVRRVGFILRGWETIREFLK